MEGIPDLEERLAQIADIRRFGEEEFGLEFGGAFERVELDTPGMTYWLYASPKEGLRIADPEQCDAGYPFELYMDREEVMEREKELQEHGFDTHLFEAGVYGSSECPITRALLMNERPAVRANDILHEGLHITQNLREWDLPYSLDEHIATYTGLNGALAYARKHLPEAVDDAQWNLTWWKEFAQSVNHYDRALTECYDRIGGSRNLFAAAAAKLSAHLIRAQAGRELRGRLHYPGELNNAFFLRHRDYTQHTGAVWGILDTVDLGEYIRDPDSVNALLLERIGGAADG